MHQSTHGHPPALTRERDRGRWGQPVLHTPARSGRVGTIHNFKLGCGGRRDRSRPAHGAF